MPQEIKPGMTVLTPAGHRAKVLAIKHTRGGDKATYQYEDVGSIRTSWVTHLRPAPPE